MADTVYNVSVAYNVSTGQAETKVDGLSKSFSQVSDYAKSAVGHIDRVAGSIINVGKWALLAAGAFGIHALSQGIAGLNAEAESATIGIAGMLQAGGAFKTFEGAMGRSQSLMTQMRRDAAALPGTFDDLRRVFEGGLLGSLAAGKTSTQAEQLAATFMAVSKSLNVDSHTAGRELSMMLEGRAGAHVVMWARLHSLIGKDAKEFNAMSSAERFAAIEKALKGFDPAIRAYAHTWDAISSTTKDTLVSFQRMATTPLFGAIKDDLLKLNDWVEHNQALVIEWEMIVGGNLVHAYQRVKDVLGWIWTHHSEILSTTRHAVEGGMIARAGLGLLGSAGGSGLARSGLTALGGLAGGGIGAGALIAAAVVGPIAIAAATGKVSLDRTWHSLENAVSPLIKSLGDLGVALLPAVEGLGQFTASLTTSIAEGLTPFTSTLGDFIRIEADSIRYWQNKLTPTEPEDQSEIVRRIHADAPNFDDQNNPINRLLSGHMRIGGSLFHPSTWHAYDPYDQTMSIGNQAEGRVEGGAAALFRSRAMEQIEQEIQRRNVHPQGNTNVNMRVELTVNDASDSSRVYLDVKRAVFDAMYTATQSPKTQVLR